MTILAWLLPALGVGGLGALTYFLGPVAMLGAAKSALGFLAKIPWQVYAIAALAIAFGYLVHDRNKWKDRAASYNAEAVADWNATKAATGNAKLDRKDTAKQIAALGASVQSLQASLDAQTAAVKAWQAQAAAEHQAGVQASQAAQERADTAEATSARLKASARAGGANAGECEPSEALKDQWQ